MAVSLNVYSVGNYQENARMSSLDCTLHTFTAIGQYLLKGNSFQTTTESKMNYKDVVLYRRIYFRSYLYCLDRFNGSKSDTNKDENEGYAVGRDVSCYTSYFLPKNELHF